MYERHFGLTKKPFGVSPDPEFLYLGASHREALASLRYGIEEGRGFISLIGEAGTGKTTLIRTLLDDLHDSVRTIVITYTNVTRTEMLRMLLTGLEISSDKCTRLEMIGVLRDYLTADARVGHKPPVLIIDEAQNLSGAVLEEIRLLTNLETSEAKLLQVILVGQPELGAKLSRPSLRQLRQRIAVRARLVPLSPPETVEYIQHRLSVAGCTTPEPFSNPALTYVWASSSGLPRLINLVCEHALVTAYGAGREQVVASDVSDVFEDLGISVDTGASWAVHRETTRRAPWVRIRLPARPTAVAGTIAALAIGYVILNLLSRWDRSS